MIAQRTPTDELILELMRLNLPKEINMDDMAPWVSSLICIGATTMFSCAEVNKDSIPVVKCWLESAKVVLLEVQKKIEELQ